MKLLKIIQDVVEPRNISTGLEKLIDQIFTIDDYNSLVRPTDKLSGLTTVNTELKLLQIDLVKHTHFKFGIN